MELERRALDHIVAFFWRGWTYEIEHGLRGRGEEHGRAMIVRARADAWVCRASRRFDRAVRRAVRLGYDLTAVKRAALSTFQIDWLPPTNILLHEHISLCLRRGAKEWGGTRSGVALDWALYYARQNGVWEQPLPVDPARDPDRFVSELPPIRLEGDISYVTVDVFVSGNHTDVDWTFGEGGVRVVFHEPLPPGTEVQVAIGVHFNTGDEYSYENVQWHGTAPDFFPPRRR